MTSGSTPRYLRFLGALAWLAGWLLAPGAAFAQPAASAIVSLEAWVEEGAALRVEQVAAAPAGRFLPVAAGTVHNTGPGRTLWLRVRLHQVAGQPPAWRLEIPLALLDEVTLHQRDGGKWQAQRAGDTLAVAAWARPGRHAAFDVYLGSAAERTVYLQVRHSDPVGFPVNDGPAAVLDDARQFEYLGLGVAAGALLVLAAWCAIQAVVHRDAAYGWYGLYAAALLLTVATVTGLASHLFWNESPGWANHAQGVLPVLLAGVHLLFLRHLCAVSVRHPWAGRVAAVAAGLIFVSAAAYAWLDAATQRYLIAVCLLGSLVLGTVMAVLAGRRGDRVGWLVLLAYLPLAVVLVAALLRLFGVVAATWLTQDSVAVGAALAVPLLLLALHTRSRYRHGVLDRLQHRSQEDALTGLMSPQAFAQRLQSAVSGALMRRHNAAVVLVDLVNLQRIREFHGDAVAEQCLLRAVIHLNRVLRDSDPLGRVATARFGVIIEGADSRTEVQERMVRLVASGLAPARGEETVPLQFRVACAMLNEVVLAPDLLLRSLGALADTIRSRSRRPIRFLQA